MMQYPEKTKTPVCLVITKKAWWQRNEYITLIIPTGTIGEILQIRHMQEGEYSIWLFASLLKWGATKRQVKKIFSDEKASQELVKILQNTFFLKTDFPSIPESVARLATKGKYQYSVPEHIVFMLMAEKYHIPPRELLEYTFDEVAFLVDALSYANLNEAQEAELERLENVATMKRENLENLFTQL